MRPSEGSCGESRTEVCGHLAQVSARVLFLGRKRETERFSISHLSFHFPFGHFLECLVCRVGLFCEDDNDAQAEVTQTDHQQESMGKMKNVKKCQMTNGK